MAKIIDPTVRSSIVDRFLQNYSPEDITNLLLDRMTMKELEEELESFQILKEEAE